MRAAEAIVAMLKAYDVEYIFGVPGDTSTSLYDALFTARDAITHVLARDERAAAFMADAYARLSGKPGVCEAPSGAGASYLLPGLAEANGSSIPLIALTTDIPLAAEGRNVLTEMDQAGLFAPVTKWRTTLRRGEMTTEVVRKAFRLATSGRAGAVQVTLPKDVLDEEVGEHSLHAEPACLRYPAYRIGPDLETLAHAAEALIAARRPVIVAGGGVVISGAHAELTALAELISSPVGTSINGQGSLGASHPLSLGVVGGNGARPYANDIVAQADLVFFIGCRTDSVTTLDWTLPSSQGDVAILQMDIDPGELGNSYPVLVGLVSDAKLGLAGLVGAIRDQLATGDGHHSREPWADIAGLRETWWQSEQPRIRSDASPIKPQRILDTISRLFPPEGVIVADAGTPTPYVSAFYRCPAGRHVVIPRAYGGLGYAIPGVIGAKLARPTAPVLGLMGDGSFAMSAGDLETIARLGLPVTLINFNNASFGWIKALQHLYQDRRYFSVDFSTDTDHAGIARAFGLEGTRVEDPADFEAVLGNALSSQRPTLIDVVTACEVDEIPPVHKWLQDVEGILGH